MADELDLLQDGDTALRYAISKGHTAVTQALLADDRVEINLADAVSIVLWLFCFVMA